MTDTYHLRGCEVLPPAASKPPRDAAAAKATRGKSSGRFGVLNTFTDATMRRLTNSQVKVWLIIFRDTKPNGLAKVSDTDMARRAGVSVRSIYSARKRLVSLRLLIVVRKGRLGAGASVYRVRPLVDEASFQNQPEASFQIPQKPASAIPEEDQKSRLDSIESGDLQKARIERAARSANP